MTACEQTPEENTPLTPEQKMQNVKINLRNTLNTVYNNFFHFLNGLPIAEDQKRFAFMNLRQALMWSDDGIEILKFEVEELPPVPTEETDINQPKE